MDKGAWLDPRAGKITFGEFAEQWRTSQIHRPSTAALVEGHLSNHVIPSFGLRPLASIRPSEIQAWARGLSDELAPATTELAFRYVSAIFKAAVDDMVIARNPCAGTRLPRRTRAQVVPLETAQVLAVIEAMPERFRCAAVLAQAAACARARRSASPATESTSCAASSWSTASS
jgi:integrase